MAQHHCCQVTSQVSKRLQYFSKLHMIVKQRKSFGNSSDAKWTILSETVCHRLFRFSIAFRDPWSLRTTLINQSSYNWQKLPLGGHVSYPTDSQRTNRLGLCSSLSSEVIIRDSWPPKEVQKKRALMAVLTECLHVPLLMIYCHTEMGLRGIRVSPGRTAGLSN